MVSSPAIFSTSPVVQLLGLRYLPAEVYPAQLPRYHVPKISFRYLGKSEQNRWKYLRASRSVLCNAALSSRCAAEQTQTITRPSSTIVNAPIGVKVSPPKLDDGGTGFPPRNDGGGGGGGGGGGPSSSGGFYFFAFLVFMNYLKELESEKLDRHRGN